MIEIRKVLQSGLEQLQTISRDTFYETYSHWNTKENMIKYVEENFSADKLRSEIDNANCEIYFAISEEKVIGYLKINFGKAQTELQDENAIEIERIYVLKKFQGNRIGQMFIEKAIQVARDVNATYIFLGVWEKNTNAIHFYIKQGFREFDKHVFFLGDDEQADLMLKFII